MFSLHKYLCRNISANSANLHFRAGEFPEFPHQVVGGPLINIFFGEFFQKNVIFHDIMRLKLIKKTRFYSFSFQNENVGFPGFRNLKKSSNFVRGEI